MAYVGLWMVSLEIKREKIQSASKLQDTILIKDWRVELNYNEILFNLKKDLEESMEVEIDKLCN